MNESITQSATVSVAKFLQDTNDEIRTSKLVISNTNDEKINIKCSDVSVPHSLTLPTTKTNGYLRNNGSGVLSWDNSTLSSGMKFNQKSAGGTITNGSAHLDDPDRITYINTGTHIKFVLEKKITGDGLSDTDYIFPAPEAPDTLFEKIIYQWAVYGLPEDLFSVTGTIRDTNNLSLIFGTSSSTFDIVVFGAYPL